MKLYIRAFEELTPKQLYAILKARVDVFVVEQQCIYPELDGLDADCLHLWLEDENGIAAYLRVIPQGKRFEDASIGRVLALRRREGLGTRILEAGIRVAEERFGAKAITLEAQTYARALYEKQGFCRISEEFLEDGIPHIRMRRVSGEQRI